MKTIRTKALLGAGVLALLAAGAGAGVVLRQGVPHGFWDDFPDAKVGFDELGIPTIEAPAWDRLLTAEGYVVASERLWQMDLIRRKAGGRLAEWFGEAAYAHDAEVQAEDRLALTRKAADALPENERKDCEAYAAGVNRFITGQKGRWGLEYRLLGADPEPWTCADSLLVVLEMAETLTSTADTDARQWVWRRHLSPAWQAFLFPDQHPWNEPLFGTTDHKPPALPPASEWVLRQPLGAEDLKKTGAVYEDRPPIGSNNWAWRGKSGHFLANDPHLGNGVPDIWYVLRMKAAPDDWTVGAAIPGIPGIVLGMNPALAWAFTNTGEDVDDLLEEHLSADGKTYEVRPGEWAPVATKTFAITVKGEAAPRQLVASFTARGPLARRAGLGEGLYARQFLALKDGSLRLPSLAMMRAKSLDELDRNLDELRVPAQNVLMMDAEGTIRYRTSGTGPVRKMAGNVPRPALEGAWDGFEPQSRRKKLTKPAGEGDVAFLATANERIWTDGFGGHNWYTDDRKDRLRTLLSARPDLTRADMERMQHDTTSRFRAQLLAWVAAHAGEEPAWKGWDGDSRSNPQAFTESSVVEDELLTLLLARVRAAFLTPADRDTKFLSSNKRAWVLAVLDAPGNDGLAPFGLEAAEVARHLVDVVKAQRQGLRPHQQENQWEGQHPFVGRIPVIGNLFAVKQFDQWGAFDTVAAEQRKHGPSMRIVWDMGHPWDSTWVFPVGQSGHVASGHYDDFQALWIAGKTVPVFPPGAEGWEFHGRHK